MRVYQFRHVSFSPVLQSLLYENSSRKRSLGHIRLWMSIIDLPQHGRNSEKMWTATRRQALYRHKSGIYYVRLGRGTWRSLRTNPYGQETRPNLTQHHDSSI